MSQQEVRIGGRRPGGGTDPATPLDTNASPEAHEFFEHRGFTTLGNAPVMRRSESISRFVMRKCLLDPPPSRWVLLGHAGAVRKTLVRRIAEPTGAALLDLDTAAWWTGRHPPRRRPLHERIREIRRFCEAHHSWEVMGCYEDLTRRTLITPPCLVWLRTGVDASCSADWRRRPFAPHNRSRSRKTGCSTPGSPAMGGDDPFRGSPISEEADRSVFGRDAGPKSEVPDPERVPCGNSDFLPAEPSRSRIGLPLGRWPGAGKPAAGSRTLEPLPLHPRAALADHHVSQPPRDRLESSVPSTSPFLLAGLTLEATRL